MDEYNCFRDGKIYGDAGDDAVRMSSGTYSTRIYAGKGVDNIKADWAKNLYVYGEDGDDVLEITGEYNYLYGGDGDDLLTGYGKGNKFVGGPGNDTIKVPFAYYGAIYGNDYDTDDGGHDTIEVGRADDLDIYGGAGPDVITVDFMADGKIQA